MQTDPQASDPTPPDCFRLEDLEALQAFEGRELTDVNYYLWLNRTEAGAAPYRFLYTLELAFGYDGALLLSSGEDSTAIRLIAPETLIRTAQQLQTLHGQVSIQRVNAGAFPLWQPAIGKLLATIRLSRNDAGLYWNDALLLDFGAWQILVQISQKEGLEVGVKQGKM
ncbi:MAG: hypothetical protein IT260_16185 [Saprospiraceae bacterium]|nr:hypothetical protein [Saprospiraceae bacterium]